MEFFESLIPLGIVLLCIAGVVALGALAYLLITMTKSVKETIDKVNPLIDEAQEALNTAKPALERIDPLMERVTLTVDAANLEIMRVDQILEDLNTVTGNVAKATESLDTIKAMPLDAISRATSRIRERIAPLNRNEGTCCDNVVSSVDQALEGVEGRVADAQERADVKRAERDQAVAARDAAQGQTNEMSSNIKEAVSSHIGVDSDAAKGL